MDEMSQQVARTTGFVVRVFSPTIIPGVSNSGAVWKLRRATVWSAAACCRFRFAQLAGRDARRQAFLLGDRATARVRGDVGSHSGVFHGKAAASCRTPRTCSSDPRARIWL